jgi:Zn-dependent membrane protease YugP
MPFVFDPFYLLFIAPALLLAMVAQWMVKSAYARAQQIPARMSGRDAARRILDSQGLNDVEIEQTRGMLSDHYDPRHKVLRLSPEVYQRPSLASVGIAAHEAGHAVQDAHRYAPLVVRNLAVPIAGFGSNVGMLLLILGVIFRLDFLLLAGIVLFSGVVIFQLVNLPVEFNASSRAKRLLVDTGVVSPNEMPWVNKVLRAAALTYVAATLQAVLTLIYYLMIFLGGRRSN